MISKTSIVCCIAAVIACSTLPTSHAFSMTMSSSTGMGRKAFISTAAASTAVIMQNIVENDRSPIGSMVMPPANAAAIPSTGVKAPTFELRNSRGEVTSLDSLIKGGKWTVLYFYPGAFTSGCTLEARGFQRDINQYRDLNTQVVGVSVDSVEKNAQFCNEEQLDFYMLSDAGGKISKLYGSALSVPGFGTFSNRQTYLLDPKGNLMFVFTDVESHVPRHSAEVLGKIKQVQAEA